MEAPAPALSISSYATLNTGAKMPLVGLGTFQIKKEPLVVNAVRAGIAAGYRHIDTASIYKNEQWILKGIEKEIPRSELFITSKLSPYQHGYEKALEACRESLKKLGTEYLDLYLIHWPGVRGKKPQDPKNKLIRNETWKALEKLQEDGLCRAIGVSNYTVPHLEDLLQHAKVTPAVNQCEYHPHLQQRELRAFCSQKGIYFEAYSSLGQGAIDLTAEPFAGMAKKHDKSAAQILLRWALQRGIAVLPKSSHPERVAENIALFDFALDDDDMARLDALDENKHFCWNPTNIL